MKLSAKTEYACLAMLQLAEDHASGRPAPLRSLSARQAIPEGFLVQILQDLRRAGLVTSTRGSCGGYRLARPPEEVSLAEVIAAIEGADASDEASKPTPLAETLHAFCDELRRDQQQRLEGLTLAEVVEQSTTGTAPMWYI